jgi:hypothetical protein
VEVKNASGILQGNLPRQAVLAIVKLRGRGTWPSPLIRTAFRLFRLVSTNAHSYML